MKTSAAVLVAAVLLFVVLIPDTAWSQLPVYYGALYGLIADDNINNCPAMTSLLTTVGNAGGGIIQLPIGKFTKLTNCNLTLPPNVIIAGSGNDGWNQGPGVTPSSGLHMTYNNPGDYHLKCLGDSSPSRSGLCGLENLEVVDDTTSTPFMLYTCGIPYLRNVMFKGMTSANGTTCAANPTQCPVNDGIVFGAGGSGSGACNDPTAGFSGYGANIIDGIYFQNIRTAVTLHDNANGLNFKRLLGDYTDANLGNYFVYIDASATSAYGNTFEDVVIEQAPNGSTMYCNYAGAFGLNRNATQNQISYVTSDIGNCAHGAYILDPALSSYWNDITNIGAYYSGGAVLDLSDGAYANGIYDMPNKKLYRQTYVGGKVVLNNGIDSPTNITGIPHVGALGGIVGLSGTTAGSFGTNTEYQLFSDGVTGTSQFTVFPFETWLGQFTLTTSNANGTQPIQMQPIYSYGSTGTQLSPTVFSIPAGAAAGSYVTNAPPLYVSAENQVSFQGVNPHPVNGTAFATVQGFTASVLGSAAGVPQTVLGTYYNGTVPAMTTYYTSFSQRMTWTNSANESHAYVVMPFNYNAKGLCVVTSSAQGGMGSLTITLHQNGVSAAPQATVLAGGGAGTWCDDSDTITGGLLGDRLDLALHNNDSATSATIVTITLGVTPLLTPPATVQPTGMIVFGLGDRGLVTSTYFAPFGGGNSISTAANAQVALPRSVTIKNLHCWATGCPSADTTLTVWKNGAAGSTPLRATIPSFGCVTPADFFDLTHTLLFGPGDTIELAVSTGAVPPPVSSCTVEHD